MLTVYNRLTSPSRPTFSSYVLTNPWRSSRCIFIASRPSFYIPVMSTRLLCARNGYYASVIRVLTACREQTTDGAWTPEARGQMALRKFRTLDAVFSLQTGSFDRSFFLAFHHPT